MKLGKDLFFSPRYLFSNIDWNKQDRVIDAFEGRLFGYFLEPARVLETSRHGFGQCLLIVASIEFLANFVGILGVSNQEDFIQVLLESAREFARKEKGVTYGKRFWTNFRNGLVHNGYIKGLDQLSYDLEGVVELADDVMVVNPQRLQQGVETWVRGFIQQTRGSREASSSLMSVMHRKLSQEVELSKKSGHRQS